MPAVKQIGNVAALPGIVRVSGSRELAFSLPVHDKCLFVPFQRSIGLPDIHAGYGFAIGNMAAFDVGNPLAVVSPGGVGFDINCGVRLVRTNLFERDVEPIKEQLAQVGFDEN